MGRVRFYLDFFCHLPGFQVVGDAKQLTITERVTTEHSSRITAKNFKNKPNILKSNQIFLHQAKISSRFCLARILKTSITQYAIYLLYIYKLSCL